MHPHCYLFTLTKNVKKAKSNVRTWLEDYAGRAFYDYAGLEEASLSMRKTRYRRRNSLSGIAV
jgi:hypothetical protein